MSISTHSHAGVASCIGCGCDDYHACWDDAAEQPCSWLVVDRTAGLGVCSACPEHQARWHQGERDIAVPVEKPSRFLEQQASIP